MKRLLRGYFPWRLYWRIFLYQILLLNVLVVLTLAVGSYVFDFHFYSTEPLQFFLMYFSFSLLAAGFFAYRFAMPFRRMLLKTIRLVSKKQIAEDERFDEEIEDEASDYFEMDSKQVNSEFVVFILVLLGASTAVFSYFSRSWPRIGVQSKGLLFSCLVLGLHFVTHYLQKTELDERPEQ